MLVKSLDSNTTLVKVKYVIGGVSEKRVTDSNTTLVKVKFCLIVIVI